MARLPHDAPVSAGPPSPGAPGSTLDRPVNGNGRTPPPGAGNGARQRPAGPGTGPALVVAGIAVLVLVVGVIGAALTSGGAKPTAAPRSLPTARGATISATPGRAALSPIVSGGQPPDDILDAVALPRGTTVTAGSATNNGIGLYDHSLSFRIALPDQRVIDFFRAELGALKWQLVSQGPAPTGTSGYRLVGQHPGSDGYEWEIGVTVAPTVFGAGSGTGTTPFTVRLFAVSDN